MSDSSMATPSPYHLTQRSTAEDAPPSDDQVIVQHILAYCNEWENEMRQNHFDKWLAYDRMFRGLWQAGDSERQSERSKLITPIIAAAVDNVVADRHTAVFGPGGFFDVAGTESLSPEDKIEVERMKAEMRRRFDDDRVALDVDQIQQLAAIYGSGFGEIEVTKTFDVEWEGDKFKRKKRLRIRPAPLSPNQIRAPSNIMNIEDMPGIGVVQYIDRTEVEKRISAGTYRKVTVTTQQATMDYERPFQDGDAYTSQDTCKVLRWFGSVPTAALKGLKGVKAGERATWEDTDGESYTEAIVHILNDSAVLMAEPNPFASGKRPILHLRNDVIFGRFWGRGMAEKAFNMQKAADANVRSHFDSLAFTAVPVFSTNAAMVPRGFNSKVYPGRNMMVNGSTKEAFSRVDMGTTDPMILQSTALLERWANLAMGTTDGESLTSSIKAGADPSALAMLMAAAVMKNQRSMSTFQFDFLTPFIVETTWRLYQFEGKTFPRKIGRFKAMATPGIMAREYEAMRYTNLMKTLGPDSPLVPMLMQIVIRSTDLPDREKLAAFLEEQARKKAEDKEGSMLRQLDGMMKAADLEKRRAEIMKLLAEGKFKEVEAMWYPVKIRAGIQDAPVDDPMAREQQDFDNRVRLGELMLKAEDIESGERVTELQTTATLRSEMLRLEAARLSQAKGPKEGGE